MYYVLFMVDDTGLLFKFNKHMCTDKPHIVMDGLHIIEHSGYFFIFCIMRIIIRGSYFQPTGYTIQSKEVFWGTDGITCHHRASQCSSAIELQSGHL